MKQLPKDLKVLKLNLHGNKIKELGDGIKQLPDKLQCLVLKLSRNNLGENVNENIRIIAETMGQLPRNLKYMELDLKNNKIE